MPSFQKGATIQPGLLRREKFPLPELGKDTYLWLRALSKNEARDWGAASTSGENKEMVAYDLIAISAINDDASPVFTDGADALENLNVAQASVIGIVEKILHLSGMDAARDRSKN